MPEHPEQPSASDIIATAVQMTGGHAVDDEARVDIELLARVVARDPNAVAALYDRHSRLLFGLALRILRDRSDAEEVLQDVFLGVWQKAETYNPALGSPEAWLVRIARNRAIDRLRARGARLAAEPLEGHEPQALASSGSNPETRAARSEEQGKTLRALQALPFEQRQLVEHAYYLGLTHSELAERFRLPLGTVKTRIRTGMLALRRQLEAKGHD